MILNLAAVLLVTSSFTVHTDTTLAVKPGVRLQVNNFGGEIAISTWGKNAVHIEAEHSFRTEVGIETTEGAIKVETRGRRGTPNATDFKIVVPAWMGVKLSGLYTDVEIEGSQGDVRAETVKGSIKLKGGRGYVSLHSVEGSVSVEGAQGKIELESVNEGIEATDVEGEISAETVNGDVVLAGVRSPSVEVSTVNGDICYQGGIAKGGHYSFATHNGDVSLTLPDDASASVSVSTFSGDFESEFKAKLADTGGKRFSFTLGSGDAEIALESFEGTVRLRRAGEKCDESR